MFGGNLACAVLHGGEQRRDIVQQGIGHRETELRCAFGRVSPGVFNRHHVERAVSECYAVSCRGFDVSRRDRENQQGGGEEGDRQQSDARGRAAGEFF